MSNPLDQHVTAYSPDNPYDFDNAIILNWYARRIVSLTHAADRALELGLGHGYSADVFASHFSRYTVLEGSRAVIEHYQARRHGAPVGFTIVETLFEAFDAEERFDVIVMGFVLEHVDDPVAVLSRFRKLLTPQGRIFVAVPNAEALNRRLGHLAGMLPDLQSLSDHDRLLGHQRYYTVASLRADADRAGLRCGLMEGIYLKPLTTAQMVASNLSPKVLEALCVVGTEYPELSCALLARLEPSE